VEPPVSTSLERYGAGSGISFGVGIGATAAVLSGTGSELGVIAGFGAIGGLTVGGFAGRFTESTLSEANWELRVVAYTLFVSLLVGGLLGTLTGWMVDGPFVRGFAVGSGAGGAFSLLLSGVLVAAARKLNHR
jgi:hypothetical protein